MLSQSQKSELSFNSAQLNLRRTEDFLRKEIASTDFIDIIDAKMYVLGNSFI